MIELEKLRISREQFEELKLLREQSLKYRKDGTDKIYEAIYKKRLNSLPANQLFDLECLLLYTRHCYNSCKKISDMNARGLEEYTDKFIRGTEGHNEMSTVEYMDLVRTYVDGKMCWASRVPAFLKAQVLPHENYYD